MCMCIIGMYVCMYEWYVYVSVCICMNAADHQYARLHVCMCVCMCVYVCVCVRVCVCMPVCTHDMDISVRVNVPNAYACACVCMYVYQQVLVSVCKYGNVMSVCMYELAITLFPFVRPRSKLRLTISSVIDALCYLVRIDCGVILLYSYVIMSQCHSYVTTSLLCYYVAILLCYCVMIMVQCYHILMYPLQGRDRRRRCEFPCDEIASLIVSFIWLFCKRDL